MRRTLGALIIAVGWLGPALVHGPWASAAAPAVPFSYAHETTAADGTRWIVTYDDRIPVTPAVADFARVALEETVAAYERLVVRNTAACATGENPDSWGYVVSDDDCVMQVRIEDTRYLPDFLLCGACVYLYDRGVVVRYSPLMEAQIKAKGHYLDPLRHDTRAILRGAAPHELMHRIQWSAVGAPEDVPAAPWWTAWAEGQARFIETWASPDVESHPTSLWYDDGRGGANGFVDAPHLGICDRSYDAALLWGFLATRTGGPNLFPAIWSRLDGDYRCDDAALVRAVEGALAAASAGETAEPLDAAMAEFSLALLNGDFRWGTPEGGPERDWAQHLDPVARRSLLTEPSFPTGALGVSFVDVGHPLVDRSFTLHVTDPDAWVFLLARPGPDGRWAAERLVPSSTIPTVRAGEDAVVAGARVTPGEGSFWLE